MRNARIAKLLDAITHPSGLFAFIACTKEFDRITAWQIRPKRFFHTTRIVGNDLIGSIQNVARTAIVLFKLDDGRFRKILFKT